MTETITPQQHEKLFDIFQRQPSTCSTCGQSKPVKLVERNHYTNETFHEFLGRAAHGYDCVMIEWCGMWLGIEKDGYAHS